MPERKETRPASPILRKRRGQAATIGDFSQGGRKLTQLFLAFSIVHWRTVVNPLFGDRPNRGRPPPSIRNPQSPIRNLRSPTRAGSLCRWRSPHLHGEHDLPPVGTTPTSGAIAAIAKTPCCKAEGQRLCCAGSGVLLASIHREHQARSVQTHKATYLCLDHRRWRSVAVVVGDHLGNHADGMRTRRGVSGSTHSM